LTSFDFGLVKEKVLPHGQNLTGYSNARNSYLPGSSSHQLQHYFGIEACDPPDATWIITQERNCTLAYLLKNGQDTSLTHTHAPPPPKKKKRKEKKEKRKKSEKVLLSVFSKSKP
jgi:hypothetical protein